MASYEGIYRAFFNESFDTLAPRIEKGREKNSWTGGADWELFHDMHLFDPVDHGSLFYAYCQMVESTRRLMSGHLEGLLRSMLDYDGREYSTGEPLQSPNGFLWRVAPLVINYDGRRIGLIFSDNGQDIPKMSHVGTFDELLVVVTARTRNSLFFGGFKPPMHHR